MGRKDKAYAILALLIDVYGQSPWTLEQIIADLSQENTDYFFEYDGSDMIGFLAIQQLVGEVEITNLAVLTDYQGKGIARQLMAQLSSREENIFLEVRESNSRARKLYEACGFVEIGRRKNYYHNPVEDAIVMQREGYDR